jgi:cell division septation protein DedD
MTPILLDQTSIFRAGVAVSFTMLVVFSSGYYMGHQKTDSGEGMELNKTIALALPGPAHADTAEYEPHIPRAQMPGAYIDVDSPDETTAGINNRKQAVTQTQDTDADVENVINETTSTIETPAVSDLAAAQDHQQPHLASLAITADVSSKGDNTDVIHKTQDPTINTGDNQQHSRGPETGDQLQIIDTATAEDARYTIQVGVFADSQNAIRRMSELESQNLSVYTNGYTNKRNELRFKVRFGYFKDKSSALAALNRFEQNMSGSGYIARIRRN